MADADVASGEEEILDVSRVEAAIGNLVGRVETYRDVGRRRACEAVGIVVVERPAAVCDGVVELAAFDDVALRENQVADAAAALAFAGEEAQPFECPVGGGG